MTFDFQTWMRAVWTSIMEPSASAKQALTLKFPTQALWMGLALAAVLNVLLLGVLQAISTVPPAMPEQALATTPFGYLAIISIFLVLFTVGIDQAGRLMGSAAKLPDTLLIMVWFQAIGLTLQVIQVVLVLISPAIAAIFGLIAFGALLWCFINFINVLHGFQSIGKAILSIFLALIMTVLVSGILLSLIGISAPGATI